MKKSPSKTKMNVKKRKKNLDKQNPEIKQRTKKRKETAKDRMIKLNTFYADAQFGIWIQCTKCEKWRKVMEYEEEHEVPEYWNCEMSLSGTRSCDEPEIIENENFSPVKFIPGAIVWAKYNGYPWWPAMIEDDPDVEEYYWEDKNGKWFYNVTFLDDKVTRAWVPASFVRSFLDQPKQKYLPASYAKYSALLAAADRKARNAINMSVRERLENFSFAHQFKGKWGSPLASENSDEDGENDKNLTQMLLDEVNDIESIESTNSDNESVLFLELKKNETDHEISSKTDSEHENEEDNITHPKIEDAAANETDNEYDHKISSKSNSECEKREKLLTEAHSSKERKLTNQEYKVHPIIKDDEINRTEIEKDAQTFVLPKGKKVKSAHIKSMKDNNKDITISLDGADENRKDDSKNKKGNKTIKISKVKNKKANKLENLEEKIDNAEENKEETRSSIKKKYSKDAKTLNENKEENRNEETLNQCSNSIFKPPIKNNENNACEDNQNSKSMNKKNSADIRLCKAGPIIKEENLVKGEMVGKNLKGNKEWDKASIIEKKTNNFENFENSRCGENSQSENELKENIVKILEKNLKSSLESMPMEKYDALTSNDSSTTFQQTLKAENKKQEKKESKKNHLKEDLANSEFQGNKKYSRKNKSTTSNNIQQKKYIKNTMKVDLLTEDLPASSKGKSKRTDTFKVPTRQNISKKEKVMRNLKADKVKETEEIIQKQDNGIAYASDEDVKEEISGNVSKTETFSLSVKINLQEVEDEDSDPFEAE